MKKIKFKSSDGQETVSLSPEELEIVKSSPKYDKTYNDLISKCEKKLERQIYFKKTFWHDLMIIALSAFGTTIAFDYFISATGRVGLFPGGLGSITRFVAVIVGKDAAAQASLYFVFYFLFNLPFIAFGIWKLGIKFSLTTTLYILLSIGFDQIITRIPVINPNDWHVIIDYQLIAAIPGQWGSTLWLFIFAAFGGIVLGWSYGQVYKVGSSTAGTDFISVYYSKTKNKNIGKVNMKINFCIMIAVIILNTILLTPDQFDESIRYSVLNASYGFHKNGFNNELIQVLGSGNGYGSDLSAWLEANKGVYVEANGNNLMIGDWLENSISITNSQIEFKLGSNEANGNLYQAIIREVAIDDSFKGYTSEMKNLIRFKYILGPSLFASLILVITQALMIDFVYPKHKIRTMMITTTNASEVETFLFESGYRNNVFVWEAQTSKKGLDVTNKKVLMVTMTVINWKELEAGIKNLDEHMNISVVPTKKVEGPFTFELKDERRKEAINAKVVENKKLMKKIEHDAVIKTVKKKNKEFKKIKNDKK